jgi:hypothetical protein
MREGDRIARSNPQPASSGEIVDGPGNDREPHAVELAQERGDIARQRPIHERLEQNGFGAVLALMHRDELAEDGIRAFSARPPSLDAADQTFCSAP